MFRSRVIWGRRSLVKKEVVGRGGGWLAMKVGRVFGRDEGPSNGDQRKTGGSGSGSEYGGKLGRGMLGGAGEDGGVHCRGAVYAGAGVSGGRFVKWDLGARYFGFGRGGIGHGQVEECADGVDFGFGTGVLDTRRGGLE